MADPHENIDALISETIAEAKERERTAFDEAAGPLAGKIVLFGAGRLGRKTLAGLKQLGKVPLAFADNADRLWGAEIEGIPVLSPGEAVRRFGTEAVFVVTIWGSGSGHRFERTRAQLERLGARAVVPCGFLFWKNPDVFLPHYCMDQPHQILEQAPAVREAFELLADDESRREFVAQLAWRLRLDFEGLPGPGQTQVYFVRDLFGLGTSEVFVDAGAFTGDTIEDFLEGTGGRFDRVIAIEPDPASFARLSEFVARLAPEIQSRIELHEVALAASPGFISFDAEGELSSSVRRDGARQIRAETLDRLLGERRATFVKMDIEGAEIDALAGGARVLSAHVPKLAICAYHRQAHLWEIPLAVRKLSNRYDVHLRSHGEECWDLVCYAIPRSRS